MPVGLAVFALAKKPSVGASSATGTAGSMIGNRKKSRSPSASLGAASAKNVPIRNMPVLPASSAVVASWNGYALPLGSK